MPCLRGASGDVSVEVGCSDLLTFVSSEAHVGSGTSLNQDLFKPVLICTEFMTYVHVEYFIK